MQHGKMTISQQAFQPFIHGEGTDLIPCEDSLSRISELHDNNLDKDPRKEESQIVGKSFEERAKYFREKYKKNSEVVAMQSLAAERMECTFNPKVQGKARENRSHEQFWKDQQEFLKAKRQRIEIIGIKESIKEDKNIQAAPKINKRYKVNFTQTRKQLEGRAVKAEERNAKFIAEGNEQACQEENGRENLSVSPDMEFDANKKEFSSDVKKPESDIAVKSFRSEQSQPNESKKLDFKELIELLDRKFRAEENPRPRAVEAKRPRIKSVHERLFYHRLDKSKVQPKNEAKPRCSTSKSTTNSYIKNKMGKELTEAFYRNSMGKENLGSIQELSKAFNKFRPCIAKLWNDQEFSSRP
eukprot:TRINITY_DN12840_c0_g1_i15.p1 TRINITY_DN12840_c0_g1~~TRINITY_DN12840_c0_g1_i15.p1  ORF type:complete len:356 (-),score=83.16 TRINITY_DN12840_c0_g1_i15:1106-2173(-)